MHQHLLWEYCNTKRWTSRTSGHRVRLCLKGAESVSHTIAPVGLMGRPEEMPPRPFLHDAPFE